MDLTIEQEEAVRRFVSAFNSSITVELQRKVQRYENALICIRGWAGMQSDTDEMSYHIEQKCEEALKG